MPDQSTKIDAYDKTTGDKVRVPAHLVDIFDNLRKTPLQKRTEDSNTPAADNKQATKNA